MKAKRRLKLLAARAAEVVARATGDDDSQLAQIAYKRAAEWAANPGTPYDNTPIREAAKKGKR